MPKESPLGATLTDYKDGAFNGMHFGCAIRMSLWALPSATSAQCSLVLSPSPTARFPLRRVRTGPVVSFSSDNLTTATSLRCAACVKRHICSCALRSLPKLFVSIPSRLTHLLHPVALFSPPCKPCICVAPSLFLLPQRLRWWQTWLFKVRQQREERNVMHKLTSSYLQPLPSPSAFSR